VARECFRVLKPDKYCAILIGDTRRNKFHIPLAFSVMERFIKSGFVLKEDIIKVQHNCCATGFWVKKSKEYNFLLIMHEHVFVFKKITQKARGKERMIKCQCVGSDTPKLKSTISLERKEIPRRPLQRQRREVQQKIIPVML